MQSLFVKDKCWNAKATTVLRLQAMRQPSIVKAIDVATQHLTGPITPTILEFK